ncbi:hypothetical protein B0H34DRAFT_800656 [Crassisporium funariophilum]|nr:hypothetical protein B0H34DRAFT_800656 [Crassisporium funariophilum]
MVLYRLADDPKSPGGLLPPSSRFNRDSVVSSSGSSILSFDPDSKYPSGFATPNGLIVPSHAQGTMRGLVPYPYDPTCFTSLGCDVSLPLYGWIWICWGGGAHDTTTMDREDAVGLGATLTPWQMRRYCGFVKTPLTRSTPPTRSILDGVSTMLSLYCRWATPSRLITTHSFHIVGTADLVLSA